MNSETIKTLDWSKQNGLIPAIIQDAETLQVLMLGYMNSEALALTLESGQVTFFSRSKNRLWTKGESSGHFLSVVSIQTDCDSDSLLIMATPNGPTCHLNRQSCFADAPAYFLCELEQRIIERKSADPQTSYSKRLMDSGLAKVAQKVGEEAVETVIAACIQDDKALLNESADLLYHLIVLLQTKQLSLQQVIAVLKNR
ncbi:MAG: bifunctional phosphoribosyl-AMP cyclohydrolase/phosphoribosyl-ATP diphosphatase HisIE [Arenimonas sp.]|nr:bifunctional phosphoribosyl-AMP cyclohydrolase/phosphoribosyl-ATP diphosphatase HisIE [Arenimonas sp.]